MKQCRLCLGEVNKGQDFIHWLRQDAILCGNCKKELVYLNQSVDMEGLSVHVLYLYNDFLENMIYQYKEGRDIALATVFFHEQIKMLEKQYKGYTICLMPSNIEKTNERGFHALKEMLTECKLPILQPFYKSENRKQSLLSYEDRQNIKEILHLMPEIALPKKRLLLVDDVCTSGATLKCAYHLVKEHKVKVEALVLCANPRFVHIDKKHTIKFGWPHIWKR